MRVLKVTNIFRLIQYLTKFGLYVAMIFYSLEPLVEMAAFSFCLIFFVGYQIWRILPLIRRINKFAIQWPLTLVDIAFSIFVKFLYVDTYERHHDADYTYFIQFAILFFAYLAYLSLLVLTFIVWLMTYLCDRTGSQQSNQNNYYPIIHKSVNTLALVQDNILYRVMLYINYFAILALVIGYGVCLYLYYSSWPYLDTLILLKISVWFEVADIFLNVAEDCIIHYIYKRTPNSYRRSEEALPGLECLSLKGQLQDEEGNEHYSEHLL